jgi:thioredoxin-like negative regulator of GroEL
VRLLSLAARTAAVQLGVALAASAVFADSGDFAEGKRLALKHRWEEAATVLRGVWKHNPDFVPGAMELARTLVYSGHREEALGVLSQIALKQKPGAKKDALVRRVGVVSRQFLTNKTQQIYQEGSNLLLQAKYRPAREQFEKALGAEPDNVEILVRIGQCFVLEGEIDSAVERLRIARRLDPYEPEISLWLGRALHQRGEVNDSLAQLKFAYETLERSERAPLWYADALRTSGNRRAALLVLDEDAKSEPFHLLAIVALARVRGEMVREGRDLSDALWSARKDLQVALSRLPQFVAGEGGRFEGELGVELPSNPADLKGVIEGLLAQLDSRLQALPAPVQRSRE